MVEVDSGAFRAKLEDITAMYPFCQKLTDSLVRTYWDSLERFSWEEVHTAIDYLVESPEQTYRPTVAEILKRLQSAKTVTKEQSPTPPQGGYMKGEELTSYLITRRKGYAALKRAKIKGIPDRHKWINRFMRDNLPENHRMIKQHGG